MAIHAEVSGNLLEQPTQRMVPTSGGQKRITEVRIMSDVWIEFDDGSLEQDKQKSSPVQITVWNERAGEMIMKHLVKGMRVVATGDLYLHSWKPSDQDRASAAAAGKELKDFHGLRLTAERVTLALNRVESVTMRAKRGAAAGQASEPADASA